MSTAAAADAERVQALLGASGADQSHAALLRASERLALASDAVTGVAHVEHLLLTDAADAADGDEDALAAAHAHALADVVSRSADGDVLMDIALAAIGWLARAAPRHATTPAAPGGHAAAATALAAVSLFASNVVDRVVWLALGGWASSLACARLQLAPEDVARAAPLGLEERGDERPHALLDALKDAQVLLGEGLLAPVVPERGLLLV